MSKIKSFKLPSSFDIYTTESHLTLDPVSKINIFVGSNNSGKSRFLRMLSIQDKYDISLADVSLSSINVQIRQILGELRNFLSIYGLTEVDGLGEEFSEELIYNLMGLPDFISLNSDSYQIWRDTFKHWEVFSKTTITNTLAKQFRKLIMASSNKALQILNQVPIHSEDNAPKRVYIPVLRGLRPIDAERLDLYAEQTKKGVTKI